MTGLLEPALVKQYFCYLDSVGGCSFADIVTDAPKVQSALNGRVAAYAAYEHGILAQ
jgi:hypothetical protein